MLKCAHVLAVLGLAVGSGASAVTIDWTTVGDPGNACDTQVQGCFGSVGYEYQIGTYEVTNAQYAEFLNAIAASDPRGLYNPAMALTGIFRSGVSGSFTYSVNPLVQNNPVAYVGVFDGMRFANWMQNGQGAGSTETGSYTLLGGTATPSNANTVTRTAGAVIALPNESEWYKAAYYDGTSASYFDYPAGSDTQTGCATPTATANSANCGDVLTGSTAVGSYTGSASPYGTFDQGGNLYEWNETLIALSFYGLRGGSFDRPPSTLAGLAQSSGGLAFASDETGFRLVFTPEPGTALLVSMGLLGLAVRRRPNR